jgi:hypothetical protein
VRFVPRRTLREYVSRRRRHLCLRCCRRVCCCTRPLSPFVAASPRREQKRSLVITELAVYNLSADRSLTLKRRIPIDGLAGVSDSEVSDEFVLHVRAAADLRAAAVNARARARGNRLPTPFPSLRRCPPSTTTAW